MKIIKPFLLSTVVAASLTLYGCANSPTGRTQILLFSGTEMSQLGAQSFEEIKKQEKISTDKKTNVYVQCVTSAITARLAPQSDFTQWEVVVFDSEQINAFALPGGKIGVYSGLLKVAVNQDQLATVIGHEIGHVMANHSNERLSRSQLANTGLQLSNLALGGAEYQNIAMAGLGLGVQYGILMPYGRAQESESDTLGLKLMAEAGFDPQQSVNLWVNMAKASGGNQPPELLSTHPSNSTRIKNLKAQVAALPASNVKGQNCKL
ncbi:peptidase M48, Ste24p [Psychromonas ingrahamii 37]|uniref:Peptidase M48, Ste24p n=1 Tax=Psychromonas ingrahamii (strain DSM 17664 / CCUG 51855 / 37) TaxID=357804 RepID=A1SVR2_PSYIN|nr:M48 family metallopeptidase [Psychromonas ingrahamii]ABM03577.1 peptidase M48, Ste24p [Psychromonas ingrahamii 37]